MNNSNYNIHAFGAKTLLHYSTILQDELLELQKANNIEPIHQTRVAARRLRTALTTFHEGYEACQIVDWQQKIKFLAKSLAKIRDTDIQIINLNSFIISCTDNNFQAGLERLLSSLSQKRAKYQSKVTNKLDAFLQTNILDAIQKSSGIYIDYYDNDVLFDESLHAFACYSITKALNDFLVFDKLIFSKSENQDDLFHRMRIKGKYLRYTLEIFSDIYSTDITPYLSKFKNIQDNLGEIHDCDVWIDYLSKFIEKERKNRQEHFGHTKSRPQYEEELRCFLENNIKIRKKLEDDFIFQWQGYRNEKTWDGMKSFLMNKDSYKKRSM